MKGRVFIAAAVICLGCVILVASLVLLTRHEAREAVEHGNDAEAWNAISDARTHSDAKQLTDELRAKLVSMSPIPKDAHYDDGFFVMSEYAVVIAKKADGSEDYVYIYRLQEKQKIVFVRTFSMGRG